MSALHSLYAWNVDRAILHNSVIGDYRLVDFIGEGCMGDVYRAVHATLERVVAIKVLKTSDSSPHAVERFVNEARIQSRLHHPHIATLYEFKEFRGRPCIIMEYVDGQTLAERIKALGRLPLSEAVALFHDIVEAVHYIHSHGIVHRDIKSSNMKINSAGQVKLLDFGIAQSALTPRLTIDGRVIGTLQYLSPERLKGGEADARSDIWALGVLFYEMVTAQMPFDATSVGDLYEKISKVNYTPPSTSNPAVPREVETIIARCLKRNPADRYSSAQKLLQDVEHLTALGEEESIKRVKPRRKTLPQLKPHWFVVASAVALVLLGVVGFYFSSASSTPKPTPILPSTPMPTQPSTPTLTPSPKPLPPPTPTESRASLQTVTIDVTEGKAEVYRGVQRLGKTPYQLEVHTGEYMELTLKREGFEDKTVYVDDSEHKKEYIETMFRKE